MSNHSSESKKVRLDELLVQRQLFPSRTKAAAALMAGEVYVGRGRDRSAKPGQKVSPDTEIELREKQRYVTRGGEKLANALAELPVPVKDRDCLDIGAAQGGFTDCLLQNGAARVTAVDVGSGSLSYELGSDMRVFELPWNNARELKAESLPYQPDLVVIDVSFISLKKVLPAVLACAKDNFDCLAMVKPQFEVGKHRVGKGGVVRDPEERFKAVLSVAEFVEELGYAVVGFASSGLPGPKGNRETFIHITDRQSASEFNIEVGLRQVEI